MSNNTMSHNDVNKDQDKIQETSIISKSPTSRNNSIRRSPPPKPLRRSRMNLDSSSPTKSETNSTESSVRPKSTQIIRTSSRLTDDLKCSSPISSTSEHE